MFLTDVKGNEIRCIENGRFYRNPDRAAHKIWTNNECSKYYLCLEDEVFEFKCSSGLLFDVNRQICDFKLNVDNCDITAGKYVSLLFFKLILKVDKEVNLIFFFGWLYKSLLL